MCVNLTQLPDQRPIIYINEASAYFNVSSNLTVANLRFSGINQMATPYYPTDFSAVPIQFCQANLDAQNSL